MTSSSLSSPPPLLPVGFVYCVLGLCIVCWCFCVACMLELRIICWGFVYSLLGLCIFSPLPPSDPSHPLTRSSPFPPFNMYEVTWIDCRELSNPEETYHQVQHCGENIDILEAMVNCPDVESMMKVVNQCTHKYIIYIYYIYIYIHMYKYT